MTAFLIDVDGVVAELDSEWLRLYNQDYNDNMKKEDWTDWDIHKIVKPECGTKIYDYLWRDDLYDNVKPIDGSLSSVQWLRDNGHRVTFVTSGIQPAKIRWLFNHGFLTGKIWQSDNDVVIAHDKSLIKGEVLLDDNLKNCEDFSGKSLLFTQPWNRERISSAIRINSWADFVAYVSKNRSL